MIIEINDGFVENLKQYYAQNKWVFPDSKGLTKDINKMLSNQLVDLKNEQDLKGENFDTIDDTLKMIDNS
jgi:hypothetical protein